MRRVGPSPGPCSSIRSSSTSTARHDRRTVTAGLRLPLATLRRRHGAPREVVVGVELADLAVGVVEVVDGRVQVALEVEARGREVVVSGAVTAEWIGECRRCLEPVSGSLALEVGEVFVPDESVGGGTRPDEGDFYLLGVDEVDLEPVVRDAVLLGLPMSPLCGVDCAGPDPDRFPAIIVDDRTTEPDPPMDPRWAALDVLRTDDPPSAAEDGSV